VNISPLARLGAGALAIGGVLNAAFLIVADGHLTGAPFMVTSQWALAHNLHFAASVFLLFGVFGAYQIELTRLRAFGHFAFVMALMGCAFYFASGVLTAAILPVVAEAAPRVVGPAGPMFHPPLAIIGTSIAAFTLGWVLFGVATSRTGIFPAWACWAVAVGAGLQAIPPRPFGPAPWIVQDVGGVIMAAGLVAIGARGLALVDAARAIARHDGVASAA
jgi:hypothetical protein